VHVARCDHAPRGSDADLRLGKIGFREADRIEHRAARGAALTVENDGREGTQTRFCRGFHTHELEHIREVAAGSKAKTRPGLQGVLLDSIELMAS